MLTEDYHAASSPGQRDAERVERLVTAR